ncbi:MAG: hypothetical protein ACRD1E_12310, partial [Terriglobales bacterium]
MGLLYRHFLRSFFISDMLAPGGDPRLLAITAAAFFATPGLVLCMYMSIFGSRLNTDPALAFFMALTMLLAGLLALVEWDELLPSRLDYLILRPLPVRMGAIVAAKLLAMAALLTAFIAVVNLFSSTLLPTFNTPDRASAGFLLRRIGAQAGAAAAGSAWAFLLVLSARGLMLGLGRERGGRGLRLGLTVALLAGLVLAPDLTEPSIYRQLAAARPLWSAPLFWFMGLAKGWTVPSPAWAAAAAPAWKASGHTALKALAWAAAAAAASY